MSLRDIPLKPAYETHEDDLVQDFYIPVLSTAVEYRRIAGFFTSSSLAIASRGIGELIANGGTIKMIACPRLSSQDAQVIENVSLEPEKYLSDLLMSELDYFEDKLEHDHVAALGWMLAAGKLELKIAVVDTPDSTSTDQLFHQKVGIVVDAMENIVSFSGSVNETASGWLDNVEEFKVFRSWREGDLDFMEPDLKKFDDFWYNKRDYVKVVDLPEAVQEKLIRESAGFNPDSISAKKYIEERKRKASEEALSLFTYQKRAVHDWNANNRRLLFEMATGTGKTRTAIVACKQVLDEGKPALFVVATPQSTLSQQWKDSFDDLEIKFDATIIADSSNHKWRKNLELACLDLEIGMLDSLIVFTTHATASSRDFISMVSTISKQIRTVFVGDETHGLGSSKQRAALLERYDYRIGLSATPSRWFDDEGSALIKKYYSDKSFVFSIDDALTTINPLTNMTFLTPYQYHLVRVYLDFEEMIEYEKLSKKISRLFAIKESSSDENEALENALFKRANLIKNAAAKIPALQKILRERTVENTLIFVSPQQIDTVIALMKNLKIMAKRFTMKEGTKPSEQFGGLSERQHIIRCFVEKDYKALIAISCLDEGIDIPSAETAFLVSSSTNPREYIQRIGRVIRRSPGKTKAEIFDFVAIPNYKQMDGIDIETERKIIEKELIRVNEMAKSSMNYREVASAVTEIWREFYQWQI